MYEKEIKELARKIRAAALDISKDSIAKIYFIEPEGKFEISATDDSGFRAILVGDARHKAEFGYAYLYVEEEDENGVFRAFKNFPTIKEIERRLKSILERENLEEKFGETTKYYPKKGISAEALKLDLSVELRNYLDNHIMEVA